MKFGISATEVLHLLKEEDPCKVVKHNKGEELGTKQPLADAFSPYYSGKDQNKVFISLSMNITGLVCTELQRLGGV